MKTLEYVEIDNEEMSFLIAVSIQTCISNACHNEDHPAYNLLLAATYYFSKVEGFNVRAVIKMHNTYMNDRIYNLKDNGYPISDPEIEAMNSIKEKIKKMAEMSGQNEIICFNLVNSYIIDMIIHSGIAAIGY